MVPYKTFARLLDLALMEHREGRMLAEMDTLQDSCAWPWRASQSQLDEWNTLHNKLANDQRAIQ